MSHLSYERTDALGIITLRYAKQPLLSLQIMEDLGAALEHMKLEPPRALLLRAEGRNFAAGADVSDFAGMTEDDARSAFARQMAVIHAIEDLDFPTIAAVQGVCLGGGLELALSCDLMVAAEEATFGQVEARMAAATFLGGVQRLASRCGPSRAMQIAYTGALFSANSFESWGIVVETFPSETFESDAIDFARSLADGPSAAYAVSKRLVRAATEPSIRNADLVLEQIAPAVVGTADFQSALVALLHHGPKAFMADPSLVTFNGN